MDEESKFIELAEHYVRLAFMKLTIEISKTITARRAVELFKIVLNDKFLTNDENDSSLRSIWKDFK